MYREKIEELKKWKQSPDRKQKTSPFNFQR